MKHRILTTPYKDYVEEMTRFQLQIIKEGNTIHDIQNEHSTVDNVQYVTVTVYFNKIDMNGVDHEEK